MVRTTLLVLLLAAAGCASSQGRAGVGGAGQEREAEPWRKDWRAFWEAVAPYAREGMIGRNRDALAFNRVFGGEVEWVGTLREVRSYPGSGTNVELEMPPVLVPMEDGGAVQLWTLSLSCSERDSGCAGWTPELVGREVRFRTSLENRTRGYQPVVRVFGDGKRRTIEVQTWGAELVGPVSR